MGKKTAKQHKAAKAPAVSLSSKKPSIDYFEKYGLQLFLGLVCLISIVVFYKYISLRNLYLFKDIGSDTLNISYPTIKTMAEYLRTWGLPKWSFNMGMGQSMFPFCLNRDPFDLLLYALGPDNFVYGIILVELLKIIGGGYLFYKFLRLTAVSQYAAVTGGLLFSFSGFMILGSGWYVFTIEAFYGALLLLAFEQLFVRKSCYLFPVAIAIIGISMPFNLYPFGLFLLMYSALRYIETHGTHWKGYMLLLGKMALLGVLGIGLSGVFLFSNILQLIESPRVSGGASYFDKLFSLPMFGFGDAMHNKTAVMRFFSSDMLGTGINFRGWQNYLEAPLFYCGLISLLLVSQLFSFLSKQERILYGTLLAVWILPVIFPFFRYAFWLFTGDYYRVFSFFVSLTLILLGVKALSFIDKHQKVNGIVLAITLIGLLILLYYPYTNSDNDVNKGLRGIITALLLVYALLIYLHSIKGFKQTAQIILLALTCMELGYFASITVNKRSVLSETEYISRTGYNDYTQEAIAYLKKTDKSFYRIDKYYSSGPAIHGSINDGMSQNYYGTSSYNSFNQMNYINFLSALGVVHANNEYETRWAPGLTSRPLLEDLCSVKYVLTKQPDSRNLLQMAHDSMTQFGDVKIYRKHYVEPMGVAYDKYIPMADFKKLSPTQKDFMLLRACVLDSTANELTFLKKMTRADTLFAYTWEQVATYTKELKTDSLNIAEHGQNRIKGSIQVNIPKVLFFSIPFDKGWSATVNGKKANLFKINAGLTGLPLQAAGKYDILLEFEPRTMKLGSLVTLVSLIIFGGLVVVEKRRKNKPTTPIEMTNNA